MTPDQWFARANDKKVAASALRDDRKCGRECYQQVGTSIEFAIKGVIMKRQRFNTWPDAASRPDLHRHNLRSLFIHMDVDQSTLPPSLRAKLKTVLSWSRGMEYKGGRMPRKEVLQIFDAAFGPDGVLEWLRSL